MLTVQILYDSLRLVSILASLVIAALLPYVLLKRKINLGHQVRFISSALLAVGFTVSNIIRFGEPPTIPATFIIISFGVIGLSIGHVCYLREAPAVAPDDVPEFKYIDRMANIPAALIIADQHGRIVTASGMTEYVIGWTVTSLVGRPLGTIIPEQFRSGHYAGMDRVVNGGPDKVSGKVQHVSVCTSQGEERPIQLMVLPLERLAPGDARRFLGIILSEETEHVP